MNSRLFLSTWVIILTACLAAGVAAQNYLPSSEQTTLGLARPFFSAGKQVYLMMPPVLVSGPVVTQIDWSPDGKYASIVRNIPKFSAKQISTLVKSKTHDDALRSGGGQTELSIYANGKLYTVWKGPLAETDMMDQDWLAGGIFCAAIANREPETFTQLVTRISGGKLTTSTLPATRQPPETGRSPNNTTLTIISGDKLYVFRPYGADSVVVLPEEKAMVDWLADGNEPFLATESDKYYAIDGSRLVPLDSRPERFSYKARQPEPKRPFSLVTQEAPVSTQGGSAVIRNLWIEVRGEAAKSKRGLVAADVIQGKLSPDGDAVAYITMEGSAYIRAITPTDVTPEDLAEMENQAIRAQIMSECKRIGNAMAMFSADYDDRLPDPAEFSDGILPYLRVLKSDADLSAFHYTFAGGKHTDIREPSTAEIGYMAGPGGVAVVYADGHVKWRAD